MDAIEILGGRGLANAFRALGVNARCTYSRTVSKESDEPYEVWELTEDAWKQWLKSTEDYERYDELQDDYKPWDNTWGWWRWCVGSNMGRPDAEFLVRGEQILAWDGYEREHYFDTCRDCNEFWENGGHCRATDEDVQACFGEREYSNIVEYLCEELGASNGKNVCALTVDLARYNNMTLAELFTKYLG